MFLGPHIKNVGSIFILIFQKNIVLWKVKLKMHAIIQKIKKLYNYNIFSKMLFIIYILHII